MTERTSKEGRTHGSFAVVVVVCSFRHSHMEHIRFNGPVPLKRPNSGIRSLIEHSADVPAALRTAPHASRPGLAHHPVLSPSCPPLPSPPPNPDHPVPAPPATLRPSSRPPRRRRRDRTGAERTSCRGELWPLPLSLPAHVRSNPEPDRTESSAAFRPTARSALHQSIHHPSVASSLLPRCGNAFEISPSLPYLPPSPSLVCFVPSFLRACLRACVRPLPHIPVAEKGRSQSQSSSVHSTPRHASATVPSALPHSKHLTNVPGMEK